MLLKRAVPSWREGAIVRYLLVPDLPSTGKSEQLTELVLLANLWRLCRDRPYAVAFVEDEQRTRNQYCQSLETRRVDGVMSQRPLLYVGQGDLSPFVPRTEDDVILLFRRVPPMILPSWPRFITDLDAVQIARADDYIKISTSSVNMCRMLEELSLVGS